MEHHDMRKDVAKILLSEEELDKIVTRLAKKIDEDQAGRPSQLLLLCILKGSIMFTSDLMKKIRTPMEIDFMKVSSYGASTVSSGELRITLDLHREHLENLDIVIVEDIVDSGNTLHRLTKYLLGRGASSVRTCTLLDKPARRKVDIKPDYVGMTVGDEFVVGYGMDYDEKYRELPFVGVLKPEIYS